MSVDVTIYLPLGTKIRDAANVIGILSGLPINQSLQPGDVASVPGVRIRSYSEPDFDLPPTLLSGNIVNGNSFHRINFCYEVDEDLERDKFPRRLTIDYAPFFPAGGLQLIRYFRGRLVGQIDEEDL